LEPRSQACPLSASKLFCCIFWDVLVTTTFVWKDFLLNFAAEVLL
jgi:hypothetical protein